MAAKNEYYTIGVKVSGADDFKKITIAARDFDSAQDQLKETLGESVAEFQKLDNQSKAHLKYTRQMAVENNKSARVIKQLNAQLNLEKNLTKATAEEQAVLNNLHRLGASATEKQKQEVEELTRALYKLESAQNATGGAANDSYFTPKRSQVATNVGFQIQDIAVQAGAGTAGNIIAAQQLPQILGALAMGAGGATAVVLSMTGAVVGLAAAFAPMIMEMISGKDATDEYAQSQEMLNEIFTESLSRSAALKGSFIELYDANKQLAELQITEALAAANLTIATAEEKVRSLNNETLGYLDTVKSIQKDFKVGEDVAKSIQMARLEFKQTGDIRAYADEMADLANKTGSAEFAKFASELVTVATNSERAKNQINTLNGVMDDNLLVLKQINNVTVPSSYEEIQNAYDQLSKSLSTSVETLDEEYARKAKILEEGWTDEEQYAKDTAALDEWLAAERKKISDKESKAALSARKRRNAALQAEENVHATLMATILRGYNSELNRQDAVEGEMAKHRVNMEKLTNAEIEANKSGALWRIEEINHARELEEERHAGALQRIDQDKVTKDLEAQNKELESLQTWLKRQEAVYRTGDDLVAEEQQRHNTQMADLKAKRAGLDENALAEMIRINGLIEAEKKRHDEAMVTAELDAQASMISGHVQTASLLATQMSSIVDLMSMSGEDIKAQTEDMNAAQKAMFFFTQSIAAANALVMGMEMGSKLANNAALMDYTGASSAAMMEFGTALGATQAGAIMGVTFAGAFDKGGTLPAGQAGIISEFGDELLGGTLVYNNSGSAVGITGREKTAELMTQSQGQGGVTIQQNITVTGQGDAALKQALQHAAKQGAQQGYEMVARDFNNDRGISKKAARRR